MLMVEVRYKSAFNEYYQANRIIGRKISLYLYFILYITVNFRWVKELNIKTNLLN